MFDLLTIILTQQKTDPLSQSSNQHDHCHVSVVDIIRFLNYEFLGNFIDLTLLCKRKYSILMILIMSIMETWQWSCLSLSLPCPHHWHHQSPRLRRIHDKNHDLQSRSHFSGIWLDLWSDLVRTQNWFGLRGITMHYSSLSHKRKGLLLK